MIHVQSPSTPKKQQSCRRLLKQSELTLSPSNAMVSGRGPMKRMPAASHWWVVALPLLYGWPTPPFSCCSVKSFTGDKCVKKNLFQPKLNNCFQIVKKNIVSWEVLQGMYVVLYNLVHHMTWMTLETRHDIPGPTKFHASQAAAKSELSERKP